MKPTHQELLHAVRKAGRGRESFTCADIRQQLGLSTKDRRALGQFHHSFRAFQKAAGEEIEKVGPNCYRLREQQQPASLPAEPIETRACEAAVLELDALTSEVVMLPDVEEPADELMSTLELVAEPVALDAAASNENDQEGTAAVLTDVTLLEAQPAAQNWRHRMQRFGHRVKRLFGRAATSDAGTAAQASPG